MIVIVTFLSYKYDFAYKELRHASFEALSKKLNGMILPIRN